MANHSTRPLASNGSQAIEIKSWKIRQEIENNHPTAYNFSYLSQNLAEASSRLNVPLYEEK